MCTLSYTIPKRADLLEQVKEVVFGSLKFFIDAKTHCKELFVKVIHYLSRHYPSPCYTIFRRIHLPLHGEEWKQRSVSIDFQVYDPKPWRALKWRGSYLPGSWDPWKCHSREEFEIDRIPEHKICAPAAFRKSAFHNGPRLFRCDPEPNPDLPGWNNLARWKCYQRYCQDNCEEDLGWFGQNQWS